MMAVSIQGTDVSGRVVRHPGRVALAVVTSCLWLGGPLMESTVRAGVNVATYQNDNSRTGANLQETILTPANVDSQHFGKLFSQPVDGEIYGEPLYLSQVLCSDKQFHNLVFVATAHDSVYAFDADDNSGANANPLWQVSFINPTAGVTSVPAADIAIDDVSPEIGITSTPVIDTSTGTLYLLAKTKEVTRGVVSYVHRLHALDVSTGAEKLGGPVVVRGSVRGSGDGSDTNGIVNFDPFLQHQRPALLLLNGVVYICWASFGDVQPYHGWVIGYDAKTLGQAAVFNATPNGSEGGIWQSGAGPAADGQGNIYCLTGNGTFDYNLGPDYGDTALKLSTAGGGLSVADYFTPFDQNDLNALDQDLGSGGILPIPDQLSTPAHLAVFAGKEGTVYLTDRDHMGHFDAGSDGQILQSLPGVIGSSFGMPAYFNQRLYYGGVNDSLKMFTLTNARLSSSAVSQSTHAFGYPGATPRISANGTNDAIVWALQTDAFTQLGPAVLHAYDAYDLSRELYNTLQAGGPDALGPAVRFTVPTVVNGKVYVPARNSLDVLGNRIQLTPPMISPTSRLFTNALNVTITAEGSNLETHYTLDGTTPTLTSALYVGPFTVTATVTIKAKAFERAIGSSEVATEIFYNADSSGDGTGLRADYYSFDITSFGTPPVLTRIDPTVNFGWGNSPPDPSIYPGLFTVRWTGLVHPLFSEDYRFYVLADDRIRLTVNGQTLIDHWNGQPPAEVDGSLALLADQTYDFELVYNHLSDNSSVALYWSSPSTPKELIPRGQLFPPSHAWPLSLTSPTNGASFSTREAITIVAALGEAGAVFGKVEFFESEFKLGEATNAPYSLIWTNAEAKAYSLTAVATDVNGTKIVSAPVNIRVVKPILRVAKQNNQVLIAWQKSSDHYVLEGSDALSGTNVWVPLGVTPSFVANEMVVTVEAVGTAKLYRLRLP